MRAEMADVWRAPEIARLHDRPLVAAAGHELLDVAAPDEAVAVRVHEELAPRNVDRSVVETVEERQMRLPHGTFYS